jgi:hypothetical protein
MVWKQADRLCGIFVVLDAPERIPLFSLTPKFGHSKRSFGLGLFRTVRLAPMSFNSQTCLEVKNFEHKNVFILATCYWQRRRGVHGCRPPSGFAEPKHVAAKYQHWLLLLKRLPFFDSRLL